VEVKARRPTPPLLPIFRSRQQAELLADVLSDPSREESLSDLARRLGIPLSSALREIERAERAGIIQTRRLGKTRLVRANDGSPYYEPLAQVLVRSFGVPQVLAEALAELDGIEDAYVFGSWAARWSGEEGTRPVGDIDLLVLGEPDRDALYVAADRAARRLGREVQVTIRKPGWMSSGSGSFHETVTNRPLMRLEVHGSSGAGARQTRS
jgi:predicted nucleotidyltransferase